MKNKEKIYPTGNLVTAYLCNYVNVVPFMQQPNVSKFKYIFEVILGEGDEKKYKEVFSGDVFSHNDDNYGGENNACIIINDMSEQFVFGDKPVVVEGTNALNIAQLFEYYNMINSEQDS